MGFWRREDDLERELRAQRPEPRRELVDEIASRIAGERRRGASRKARLGVAVALTAGMVGALGAFGGLGYAANGVSHAVTAAVRIVIPNRIPLPTVNETSAMAQYKVAVCFHGNTLSIDSHAVNALVAAGATEGACRGGSFTPKPGQKLIRACFHGQNVSIDNTALITLQKQVADARRALRDAIRTHKSAATKERLLRELRALDARERAMRHSLTKLGIEFGFCKT